MFIFLQVSFLSLFSIGQVKGHLKFQGRYICKRWRSWRTSIFFLICFLNRIRESLPQHQPSAPKLKASPLNFIGLVFTFRGAIVKLLFWVRVSFWGQGQAYGQRYGWVRGLVIQYYGQSQRQNANVCNSASETTRVPYFELIPMPIV